jgi:rubrerythrin
LEIVIGDDGKPECSLRPLSRPSPVPGGPAVAESVHELYDACCRDSVELLLCAEDARARGNATLSRLSRAGAEAAFLHAKNLCGIPESDAFLLRLLAERADAGREVFASLQGKAAAGLFDDARKIFLCRSCAAISAGAQGATYCPDCGAPGHRIEEIT